MRFSFYTEFLQKRSSNQIKQHYFHSRIFTFKFFIFFSCFGGNSWCICIQVVSAAVRLSLFLKHIFHWTATEREGELQIIDFIGMKYVKKDDIIRMSQMYDCSCEVGTSRSIGCFTSIYLQTVVDFVIGSFNEFKCLRKKNFSCI